MRESTGVRFQICDLAGRAFLSLYAANKINKDDVCFMPHTYNARPGIISMWGFSIVRKVLLHTKFAPFLGARPFVTWARRVSRYQRFRLRFRGELRGARLSATATR